MASATDVFARASNGTRPTPTTLTAILASGSSPGTATCAALTGWSTTTKVHFCIYTINTSGAKVAGSQTDWVGTVSGSTITGLALKAGTNVGYSVGAVVEASPIAAYADDLYVGLSKEHNVTDGSHSAITATSLVTTAGVTAGSGLTVSAGSVTVPNNTITAAALATTSINLASVASSTSQSGVTSSDVIVTGLTSTVTIPAGGRRVRVEVLIPDMGSTAIAQWGLSIYNSATVTGSAVQKQLFLQAAAGTRISGYTFFEHTPSAGSQSYCAAISVDTGTGTTVLTSAKLAYLTVRLV